MAYYIVPGTGNRYAYQTPYNWRGEARGQNTGFQNGQFGYYNYTGVGTNARFTPFSQQPTQTPMSVYNPTGYARQQYANQTQEAMDEARRLTEERYQQALQNLEDVGLQEGRDIDERFDSSRSAVNQNLVNSGLANTTVLPTMQQGVERERTASRNRLATMLARERNQIIQSRNDIPPDLNLYSQLLYRAGAGGV